jgi:CHAT domain-containing protein
VLLSFAVDTDRGLVFVVEAGLRVEPLAGVRGADLRRAVERLRRLVEHRAQRDVVTAQAARLGEMLLAPVVEQLAGADRIVIVPDGPLHVFPLAMLEFPDGSGRSLVEVAPFVTVASTTVVQQLRDGSRNLDGGVVAFGDPDYGTTVEPARTAALLRSGVRLQPLPSTRLEVLGIAELLGQRAEVWLGSDATEDRVQQVGPDRSILHFACHGFADERRPLDSGLVLSPPPAGRDVRANGVLQAWEIIERLRIDSDLVVLSACDTALGEEVASEGIVGLTRAFQYAGARTVLASLWSVADISTAELMKRFYAHLVAGRDKALALQQAQLELRRAPLEVEVDGTVTVRDATHPFHWAAFQLVGDWQ